VRLPVAQDLRDGEEMFSASHSSRKASSAAAGVRPET
jgi:hypothetical protein